MRRESVNEVWTKSTKKEKHTTSRPHCCTATVMCFLAKKRKKHRLMRAFFWSGKWGELSGSFSLSIVVKLYHPLAKMKRSKIHELSTRNGEENCAVSIYKKVES